MVNGWKITAVVFMIFLVGFGLIFINADSIFNEKIYDEELKKVTIRDRITKNLRAEITLTKNSDICGEFCYAEGEILLGGNEKIIDSLRFKRKNYNGWDYGEINDYTFYINKSSKIIDVEEQVLVCDELNITCGYEPNIHQEEVVTWEEYDDKEREPGLYKWRIEGIKDPFVTVDWLATFIGLEIDEWALWTGVDAPVAYWSYDNYHGNGTEVPERVNSLVTNGSALNISLADITPGDWVNGILGEAVAMHGPGLGDNDYGQATYNNTMNLANSSYTYSIWTNMTFLPAVGNILLDAPNSDSIGYKIWINKTISDTGAGSNVTCLNHTATTDVNEYVCGVINLEQGVWNHIVVTYDITGQNATIYVNGAADNSSYMGSMVNWTAGNSYHGLDQSSHWEGIIDEIGLWKRALTGDEIATLYNGGSGLPFAGSAATVDLISPTNTSTVSNPVQINCTANAVGSNWVNITLWLSHGGIGLDEWHRNLTNIVEGTTNATNFSRDFPSGTYTWNCEACAADFACYNATGNYTFSIDIEAPTLDYISHNQTQNYTRVGHIETLYWNVIDDVGVSSCGYNYNGTNVTIPTCSDNSSDFEFEEGNFTILFYASDAGGNENTTYVNWSYKIYENATGYNSTSYVSNIEGIKINVSSDGTQTVTASINYNGSIFASTKSGDNSWMTFSNDVNIPLGAGNKSFFWNINYGGDVYSTDENNQTINPFVLGFCNSTLTVEYLNFTFKDEGNQTELNASAPVANFDYWIQNININQSYSFLNNTDNFNYSFCFDPQNITVNLNLVFKYSRLGYPVRTFSFTEQPFTNISTNQVLYMLATADGIYSSISVIEASGSTIGGVVVTIEREILGIWTIVGQAVTGSDGLVTFWVNPNYAHRISASKTGYVTSLVTITPSQSLYTLVLGTAAGNATYSSELPGLEWILYPGSGSLTNGTHNFNVTITSTQSNLQNCKLELLNVSDTSQILAAATDATNATYCYVNFDYTTVVDENLFGRLSVDTTDTDGFVIVDTDWKWIIIDIEINAWRTIPSFFSDITSISEFGEGNEGEFGRIVLFFVITTILLGVFTFFSGVELSSPGMSLLLIWLLVFAASVGGFLTFDSGSDNVNDSIEKFGFFVILTLFMLGYGLNILRRENE